MARGLGFLASRGVSRWMQEGHEKMRGWRTFGRTGDLKLNFILLVRTPGFLIVAIDGSRVIDYTGIILLQESRGV